jgi:hypothetical protein
MRTFGKLIAFGFAATLVTGAAFAQAPAPAPAAPAPTTSAPAESSGKHPQSARSAECSKEADAQRLHGRKRKHFRDECKRGHAGEAQ